WRTAACVGRGAAAAGLLAPPAGAGVGRAASAARSGGAAAGLSRSATGARGRCTIPRTRRGVSAARLSAPAAGARAWRLLGCGEVHDNGAVGGTEPEQVQEQQRPRSGPYAVQVHRDRQRRRQRPNLTRGGEAGHIDLWPEEDLARLLDVKQRVRLTQARCRA